MEKVVRLMSLEKEGESWNLVKFERRTEDLIVDLIFFSSCKDGLCDSVMYGPSLSNLFTLPT